MANYIVNGEDLEDVADAIRLRSGGSALLEFPSELISSIANIPTGSGYTRQVCVPLQTVTTNSSRQATLSNTSGSVSANEFFAVTYDSVEYICTSAVLWTNNYVFGDPVWCTSTSNDYVFPFAIDYYQGTYYIFSSTASSTHTVKIEKLLFDGGASTLTSKSITANGTYTAAADSVDGFYQAIVNVAGTAGLVYESGTYTPTSDTTKPTISFTGNHTKAPVLAMIIDATGTAHTTTYTAYAGVYVDTYRLSGNGFPYSSSAYRYGFWTCVYRSNSSSSLSTTTTMFTVDSDDTSGSSGSGYAKYYATASAFTPYSTSTSRYWRSGRTYKWIAVWLPNT